MLESKRSESFGGRIMHAHNERQAQVLLRASLPIAGVADLKELKSLRKSDPRKQAVVWLIKSQTTMQDRWVSDMLNAGSRSMLHHAVQRYNAPTRRADRKLKRNLKNLIN